MELRVVARCKQFRGRIHDGATCLRQEDQDETKVSFVECMQFLPQSSLVVCASRVIFLQPCLLFLRNRFRRNFLQSVILHRWYWWRRSGGPVGHVVSKRHKKNREDGSEMEIRGDTNTHAEKSCDSLQMLRTRFCWLPRLAIFRRPIMSETLKEGTSLKPSFGKHFVSNVYFGQSVKFVRIRHRAVPGHCAPIASLC
jgi:hypothetical protein